MVDLSRLPGGDSSASQGEAQSHTQGSAKTLTQIIMEQLNEAIEIRYGGKLKVLWNQASKAECQMAFQEISQVVKDTLSRIHADFRDQNL